MSNQPIKKIKPRYQGSSVETQKTDGLQSVKKGKKLLFNKETKSQPSDEVSQKKLLGVKGGEDLPDGDLTEKEWCM